MQTLLYKYYTNTILTQPNKVAKDHVQWPVPAEHNPAHVLQI